MPLLENALDRKPPSAHLRNQQNLGRAVILVQVKPAQAEELIFLPALSTRTNSPRTGIPKEQHTEIEIRENDEGRKASFPRTISISYRIFFLPRFLDLPFLASFFCAFSLFSSSAKRPIAFWCVDSLAKISFAVLMASSSRSSFS